LTPLNYRWWSKKKGFSLVINRLVCVGQAFSLVPKSAKKDERVIVAAISLMTGLIGIKMALKP
jgi:hypothetical protein